MRASYLLLLDMVGLVAAAGIVIVWLAAAVGVMHVMRRQHGTKPLRFWQFTTLQFLILMTVATFLFWILRLWYLDHFEASR